MRRGKLRDAAWLTAQRVTAYGWVLLVLELALLAFLTAGTYELIVPLERPVSTDYVSFYAAGALADAGTPALAYNYDAHYAAQQQAAQPGIVYNYFFYPPVMLLLCGVLAWLPYLLSFFVFQFSGLALFVAMARGILAKPGWSWLPPLLASPAGFYVFGLGQNSFLSAALFGGATLVVDRRPWLGGLLFGLLCYKPHFGLLIPIALLAGQHWRALASATLTVLGLVAASVALFGVQTWKAFFETFATSPAIYESGRITLAGFVSVFGGARVTGLPPSAAYAIQAASALVVAGLVAWAWYRRCSIEVRAAMLIAGTFLAVPLALVYDLTIVAGAGLWLVRAGRRDGFLPYEKMLLVLAFLVPVMSRGAALQLYLPVGVLGALIPMALAVRRALRERRGTAAA